ncbi:unnamed protein product [Brachionus calyciflorus]|uniref:SH3 domain-binding protein 5-like protein n=1 Tax=Brachionus calyciflorus TaxID=104777 RepID=A0A813MMK8_9BILA|nr:unnamed protein product [Brachionus calyciflorus]
MDELSEHNTQSNLDNDPNSFENESDEHLPRVQVELEKLNYSNEAINNLELELEESKREYLQTANSTEVQLNNLEKKLGNCVEKARPYYEARIELNEAKEKYLVAKNLFETAQELYVAAKNMQMYAEESLENLAMGKEIRKNDNNSHYDKETLNKMLELSKIKVNETELSKQSSDLEQIEAFKVFEEKRIKCEDMEKLLKKWIEKSRKYYELKSNLYKELRFLYTKIECLKSCLKEAKSNYQESLRNLELISTEIHEQRQSMNPSYIIQMQAESKEDNFSKLTCNSISSFSSSSSLVSANLTKSKSIDQSEINLVRENYDEEDFDVYFKNDSKSDDIKLKDLSNKNSVINQSEALPDEHIDNLKLDNKLKMYKDNLDENIKKDDNDADALQRSSSIRSLPNSPLISKIKVLFNK